MRELHITGDTQELLSGAEALSTLLDIRLTADGIPVQAVNVPSNGDPKLRVVYAKGCGRIEYVERIHFFRGLGLFLEHLADGESEFDLTEPIHFDSDGIMIDISQANALPQVQTLQALLNRMALMGLSRLMLYLEDSYEVAGEPWFGYMRGRYTRADFRAIDDWADQFGIEVVPAIQTLAHLGEALKWSCYASIRENAATLLPGEEASYQLIEKMLAAVDGCFRSRTIHIGMDEAWGLGEGASRARDGEVPVYDIMIRHLQRVAKMCAARELTPMIWGDMFFRAGSESTALYGNDFYTSAVIPPEMIRDMPKNVQLVFWEYNRDTPEFYENAIDKHRLFEREPVFAGGVWNWVGFGVNYALSFDSMNAALEACRRKNVREVMTTLWGGDDGTENPLFSNLLGFQFWAEQCYSDHLDAEKLTRRFRFCTGCEAEDFWNIRLLDEIPGVAVGNAEMSNPSKYLTWQNVLLGVFDANAAGRELGAYYAELAEKMETAAARNGAYNDVFKLYARLSRVLERKAELGIQITAAYRENDRETLSKLTRETLPEVAKRLDDLRLVHRELWHDTNLPFGWEILDLRYGTVKNAVSTAQWRLERYLAGEESSLPELEQERLPFDGMEGFPPVYRYGRMPSASKLT